MSRILLVEDNDDLRDIFAEVLRRDGFTVVEAGDGQAALEVLQHLDPAPDLVFLDLMMPKVSGVDVLRHIAESERLSRIPVVVVSASPDSLRHSDRPVLSKPVEPRSLLEVARRYLPQGRSVSARDRTAPRKLTPRPSRGFVQTLRATGSRAMLDRPMSLQSLRLLVVEDDPDSLDLLTFALESKGAHVRGVSSVKAALSAAQAECPSAVVADVELVDGDGYALLTALRAVPGAEQMPAIALTGHATSEAKAAAMAAGFNEFLTKPVSLAALNEALVRLTSAPRPVPARVDARDPDVRPR